MNSSNECFEPIFREDWRNLACSWGHSPRRVVGWAFLKDPYENNNQQIFLVAQQYKGSSCLHQNVINYFTWFQTTLSATFLSLQIFWNAYMVMKHHEGQEATIFTFTKFIELLCYHYNPLLHICNRRWYKLVVNVKLSLQPVLFYRSRFSAFRLSKGKYSRKT